jgi:hypothetical protein
MFACRLNTHWFQFKLFFLIAEGVNSICSATKEVLTTIGNQKKASATGRLGMMGCSKYWKKLGTSQTFIVYSCNFEH